MQIAGESQPLLDNPTGGHWPNTAEMVTTKGWYLTCLNNITGGGQGFEAHAPNGDTYKFDKFYKIASKPIIQMSPASLTIRPRSKVIIAATEITDKNGNWVKYDYDNSHRLTKIHASDGREITLQYSGTSKLVSSVTANPGTTDERVWTYTYRKSTFDIPHWEANPIREKTNQILSLITQPDSKVWSFNLDFMSATPAPVEQCLRIPGTLTVTHPYGVTGTFEMEHRKHRNHLNASLSMNPRCPDLEPLGIPGSPAYDANAQNYPYNETFVETVSVVKKTVSASGLTDMEWEYIYEQDIHSPGSSANDPTNFTRVIDPVGNYTYYYHFWNAEDLGGQLDRKRSYNPGGGAVLQVASNEYVLETGYGETFNQTPLLPETTTRPSRQTKSIIVQDGDTFTTEMAYELDQSSLDYSFGNPIQTKSYSNVSTTPRITDTTYEHKTANWILGLPKTVTITDGNTLVSRQISSYDYDPLGRKIHQYKYGHLEASFAYNTDGTVHTLTQPVDGATNRVTEALDWKRGTPQEIKRNDGISTYQEVDDIGWLSSTTNALGYTTHYTRDPMGRLIEADPQFGNWDSTFIDYDFSGGGAIQTISKGQTQNTATSQTTITYDSMFRPTLEKTEDLTTGWKSYANTTYDAMGRAIFTSQPSANSQETKGVDTTYDGLGRVKTTYDNVAQVFTATHSYLDDHRHVVTDASGMLTQYQSRGYDGPGSEDYIYILKKANSSNQQKTTMFKNIWGQMTTLQQRGYGTNAKIINQSFAYDTRQRLCRHYAPEHGATLYKYNDIGQITAYAKGQPNIGCGSVPQNPDHVDLEYDALGRLTLTDFKDPLTPDITRTYDDNGNVLTLNRGSGAAAVNWTYSYNDADMLTDETLFIASDNRTNTLSYTYNDAGHITQRDIDGEVIGITPDGLGRDSFVSHGMSPLASSLAYHPSGQLTSFTYGSFKNYHRILNDRLLPSRLLVNAEGLRMDLRYYYDDMGRVTQMLDNKDNANDRTYGYDDLGRLDTATGPWGTADYSYDAIGNILSKSYTDWDSSGQRDVTLSYDGQNRLSQSADTGHSGTRTVAYDTRGNVTTLGNIAMVYDRTDQPTVVTVDGSNGNYVYDGNLRRVKAVVGGDTIFNLYDAAGTLVMVDNQSDDEITRYVRAGGQTIARLKTTDTGTSYELTTTTYMHADHLGSASFATNENGFTIWSERYAPFGETLLNPMANDNQAGFTGHIKDKATGLNYMQARYYDPVIGRFLSNDPVSAVAGGPNYFNRYAYTFNDPINKTDPTGMAACSGTGSNIKGGGGAAMCHSMGGSGGGRKSSLESGGGPVDPASARSNPSSANGSNPCAGVCAPSGNWPEYEGNVPFSVDFMANYLSYNTNSNDGYTQQGVIEAAGLSGKLKGDAILSGSCAIRVSCALSALGIDLPSGSRMSDGSQVIPGTESLRKDLTTLWGGPRTSNNLTNLRTNLAMGQAAIVIRSGHAGVVTNSYIDPHNRRRPEGTTWSYWILPQRRE